MLAADAHERGDRGSEQELQRAEDGRTRAGGLSCLSECQGGGVGDDQAEAGHGAPQQDQADPESRPDEAVDQHQGGEHGKQHETGPQEKAFVDSFDESAVGDAGDDQAHRVGGEGDRVPGGRQSVNVLQHER